MKVVVKSLALSTSETKQHREVEGFERHNSSARPTAEGRKYKAGPFLGAELHIKS
jgi:hypothetical protein